MRRLEEAIAVASELDAQQIGWTLDVAGHVAFLLADGSSFPVAAGDALDQQIELVRSAPSAFEARRALTERALDPNASHDLKWLRERLAGSSTPKFRTTFLVQAGLLKDGVLTELGQATGFFHQHDGEYGPYQTVTAKGIAWIYAAYLAGNVPMTAAAKKRPPQPDIELDAILAVVGVPANLDPELAALMVR